MDKSKTHPERKNKNPRLLALLPSSSSGFPIVLPLLPFTAPELIPLTSLPLRLFLQTILNLGPIDLPAILLLGRPFGLLFVAHGGEFLHEIPSLLLLAPEHHGPFLHVRLVLVGPHLGDLRLKGEVRGQLSGHAQWVEMAFGSVNRAVR